MKTLIARALALLVFVTATALHAQVPQLINYQGRVAAGATNFDGSGQFKFALVNEDATTTFWSNDNTSVAGSQPTAAVALTVTKGLYSVLLGDTALAGMAAIPASVWTNPDVRLRVWFNDGTNGSQLLAPDQRLAPNGYLPEGSVSSAAIASGAITNIHLAAGAVGSMQLGSGLTLGGTTAGTFSGSGADLSSLSGSNITTGTVPAAALGNAWQLGGNAGTVPGTHFLGTTGNQPLEIRANGQLGLRLVPAATAADLTAPGNLSFGMQTRQMLNLWDTKYGIGVQSLTTYFRCDNADGNNGFAWFRGGVHSDVAQDPGFGGQEIMSLTANGLAVYATGDGVLGRTSNGGASGVFGQNTGGGFGIAGSTMGGGSAVYGSNVDPSGWAGNFNGRVFVSGGVQATGAINGVQGTTSNGGGSGVYGENNGAGYGVAGRTTLTGVAIFGDNANPTGWAGYFNGNVNVYGTTITRVLTITGGADIAEPFKMSGKDLPKGAVVVIDEANPGHLRLSQSAYDTRVAGIISGANGVNPGISLSQQGVMEGDQNVALSGRVYVQADTSSGPIKPGDLLTTSATPGHAMKVADHGKAQGAILGKAMTSLEEGQGMVLVLVTLQ